MMALLDRDVASALHPLVSRIASEYPQAVVYPFMTAKDGYNFSPRLNKEKAFVKK